MTSLRKGAWPIWGVSLTWIFVGVLLVPRASEAALQRFVERPESVSVREGGSVTLRCVVANQQGRVQWTKDGFALGFDRDVPGYPRYTYLGEARLGEHHLRIQGATLTEDGEYQCQVGPTDGTPPIWAAANVTVLVPPASVRILGWNSGATVEMVSGVPVPLECLANEARPPATLTWSRDGSAITNGDVEERVEESSLVERRWDARSRLHLTPTPADDGRRFFCQAAHAALEAPLLAFVTLSVLYPPGRPTISGYSPGEALREGETLILTCRASGGKPPPWLVWRRGGRVLDDTSATEDGGGVVNALEVEVSAAEDGAVFECEVNSDLLEEELRTNVTLTVHYPPSAVHIRGPSQVEDGAPVGLTCETNESRPPAVITWLIQGRAYDSEQTLVTRVSTGGWITTSDLTKYVMRSNQAREVTVRCEATNPSVHGTVTATKVIFVTPRSFSPPAEPASPPVLLGDLQSPLPAGSLLPLACASYGGHPPPTIRIYKEATEVPTDLILEGNVTRAEGQVTLTAADNGALISCELVRPGTRSPLITTGKLSVQFAPWEVSATATPPSVPEDSEVRLSCTSSSSAPPSVVSWSSGGVALEGAVTITTQGAFGGTTTRSDLRLRVKAADNGRTIRCEADNGVSDPVSTFVTLDVLHRPRWVVRPPPRVDVQEGHEVILTAAAAANPGPPRYWWRRGEQSLETSSGELVLGRVLREHAGNYSVDAYSKRGSVNATFVLNVLYGPENLKVTESAIVSEGDRASLTCSASGNPAPELTWTASDHARAPSSGRVLSRGVGVAVLEVESAAHSDTGIYLCHAQSEVGEMSPTAAKILVRQAASMITAEGGSPRVGVGGRGRLVCRVRAWPPPTFSWSTQMGALIANTSKYAVLSPQLEDDLVLWRSVLEVNEVVLSDYSVYRCAARNDLGGDMVVIALRPPARPRSPANFTIVNATETSLTVAWTPNYEEGTPEGYTLQYRAEGTRKFQSLEIEGGDTTEATLTGLSSATEYKVVLKAKNDHGESDHLAITTRTRGRGGDKGSPAPRKTRMVFVLMTLCGLVLLVLNVVIIACIFRRRRRRMLRASSRTKAKSETPVTCDDTDGFLPLKTRTPSGSAQCQGDCRDGAEDCEHTSLMEQGAPSGSSARASHRQSAGPSLGKTPPREDATLPQNGGVPSKKSPARERRRKGRSAQRDVSPDARGEEECCPASSVPLPTPPAALYGNLDAAAHVLPFAAPRHVHSHTHSCIIHSPQDQPPHLHAPVFIPSVYDGRDFAHTLPGRQYMCRDHQRRPPQGHGQQDGHHECQAQSPKAYHQGPHQPYQGEYQARPMQHRGYQEQRAAYQGQQEAYQRQHQAQYQAQPDAQQQQAHVDDSPSRQRPRLPRDGPAAQQTYLDAYGLEGTGGAPLEDPAAQYPAEGAPVTVLTEEDQTSSFLETLQRPPEAFADPTSFDHPVYFLPHHPEGHGPPLPSPALPPRDGRHGLPPLPLDASPSRPLPYSHQHTPAPFDQDRPPSSGRSPSQSRPPPPSPGHRHPTPPTPRSQHPPPSPGHRHSTPPSPRDSRRPSPPTPKTPTSRRPSPSPKGRRAQQPPDSPSQAPRPPPAAGPSRPPPSPKQRAQPLRVAPSPTVERRRLPLASSQQLFRSKVAFKRGPSPPPPPPPPPPPSAQFARRPRFPDDFLWQRGVGRTPGQDGADAVEGGPNTTNRTR